MRREKVKKNLGKRKVRLHNKVR